MPAEIESPITTRWSLDGPITSGIWRWEYSTIAIAIVIAAKKIATGIRENFEECVGAARLEEMIQIRNKETTRTAKNGEIGGEAMIIRQRASQHRMFRARTCMPCFRKGDAVIANRRRAAPG